MSGAESAWLEVRQLMVWLWWLLRGVTTSCEVTTTRLPSAIDEVMTLP